MGEDVVEGRLHLAQQGRDGLAGECRVEQDQAQRARRIAPGPDVGVVGVAVRDQHRQPGQGLRIEQAAARLEQLAQRVPVAHAVDGPGKVGKGLPGHL